MKLKKNSQTRRNCDIGNRNITSFTIPVPKIDNFCNWRQQ